VLHVRTEINGQAMERACPEDTPYENSTLLQIATRTGTQLKRLVSVWLV